ncbi:MAG TPA: serine hydrolase domain-containing protein, partial [Verrucomicrobiae bacterium]|nr:serine hydrolase domain-containing protein [Verrucomicrobiae bacterium]
MNVMIIARSFCCAAFLLAVPFPGTAQSIFTAAEIDGIKAFLRDDLTQTNAALVIGLVDENGRQVFGAGTLDNGTRQKPDGDTVFFLGSVSKTFTTLLLEDMVDRGQMKLDDPVAGYLPASVRMPARNGKEITLFHLASASAGIPINPDNMTGADVREQYETYTVEKMYAYLSGFTLTRDPGTEFEYSNLGMALLGHVMALKVGTNFESLLVSRICRPLHMDSTCITLTPELKTRLAMGHDASGKPSPPWKFQVYSPAGNIHSTANDLLKYASANAGLTTSSLTPLMAKTHEFRFTDLRGLAELPASGLFGRTGMDWVDRGVQPPGMDLRGHAGGSGSYHAWVGFDKKQRRGVVVLSTANNILSVEAVGWTLLRRLPLTRESALHFEREIVGLGASLAADDAAGMVRITKI